MTLFTLSLISLAFAGPEPYTPEDAIEVSSVVVTGEAVDVTCLGWIEGDGIELEYEARYDVTVVIEEVVKGDYAPGEELTITFTEAVGDFSDWECGWWDTPIHTGLIAEFYLDTLGDGRLAQVDYTEPTFLDDSQLQDLPDCAPPEDPEDPVDPEDPEDPEDPTDPSSSDEDDTYETDEDGETDSDASTDLDDDDHDAKNGCQVASAPTGMATLLAFMVAIVGTRRER